MGMMMYLSIVVFANAKVECRGCGGPENEKKKGGFVRKGVESPQIDTKSELSKGIRTTESMPMIYITNAKEKIKKEKGIFLFFFLPQGGFFLSPLVQNAQQLHIRMID